jgi:hypothetical protein
MRTPTPATHSQDARRALLRRTWKPPFDSLAVDYSGPDLRVTLTAGDRVLLSGTWGWETTASGPLAAAGSWEEVCWHSDQLVDYLELELALTGGWKLQRQMVLARKDQFLYLADALMGPVLPRGEPAREIRHSMQLPLAENVSFEPAEGTREGEIFLKRKRVARLLPPALPEWRTELCPGELALTGNQVVLRHAAQGSNLYAPLWLDLSTSRLRRECTWRRLTVGEDLKIQPRDVAAGYRVQAGKEQWLIYRSLAPKRSRTILGQNFATDFVLCRFKPDGTTEDIVEIE